MSQEFYSQFAPEYIQEMEHYPLNFFTKYLGVYKVVDCLEVLDPQALYDFYNKNSREQKSVIDHEQFNEDPSTAGILYRYLIKRYLTVDDAIRIIDESHFRIQMSTYWQLKARDSHS